MVKYIFTSQKVKGKNVMCFKNVVHKFKNILYKLKKY